jgi:hypothetical protein
MTDVRVWVISVYGIVLLIAMIVAVVWYVRSIDKNPKDPPVRY